MIIIETTTGPVMINDREVRGIEYNKENAEVVVTFANDMPTRLLSKGLELDCRFEARSITIKNAENIFYIGDQCNEKYKYEGGEVESLKKQLEKQKHETSRILKHFRYMREWYEIYSEAIYDIKDSLKKIQEDKIYKRIDYIIKQAEETYNESVANFKKID